MNLLATKGLRPPSRGAAIVPSQKAQEPVGADQILDSIVSHFGDWDRNHNGQISWSEMRANVGDAGIQGEEAVSLATLYALVQHDASYRGLIRKAPVTVDRIYDLHLEYDVYDTGDDFGRPVVEAFHEKYSEKLSQSAPELFPQGMPSAHKIQQGLAPSCGFLSVTYAQASRDPESVRKAIQETPDGVLVSFPGLDKPIETTLPTDTERALFATAEENGSWLATLEKAWGIHQSKNNPDAAFEMSTYPEEAITAWTTEGGVTTRVPKNSKPYRKGEVPWFLRTSKRTLENGGTVIAWTKFDEINYDDFVTGHAYTLTDIDSAQGTVSLRNPWGRKEPLNENGQPIDGVDDGAFTLSMEDFQGAFLKIARQT